MRRKLVYKFIGKVLVGFSLLFLFPIMISLIYHENIIPFLIPQIISLILGLLLNKIKIDNKNYYAKDSFYIVSLAWIIICIIGSIPFIVSGVCNPVNAFFETVSGFTTTGSTIFSNVEILPKGILFWRSFSHFIGGMGVLAFVMTIIPLTNNDKSMHLLKAEMPGPSVGKLVPNIRKTLIYLYSIYIGLTFIEFILLIISGLNIFDSLLLSLSTAGTGGFSVLNTSLSTYSSISKIIVTIFMFLFGVNFNIYFLLLMKKFNDVLKSEELKVYFIIFILSSLFIFINTVGIIGNTFDSLIGAFFHVSSIMTSTGFSIGDINIYPTSCRVLFLLLMIISACAGSTCGGFKISRMIICLKGIKRDLVKVVYPNRVDNITFEGKKVTEEVLRSTNIFLFLYVICLFFIILLISFDNYSLETTVNAAFTTFGNVGLCFDISDFNGFSNLSKIVMSIGMLLGRLEIFPIIALLIDYKRK